MSFPLFGRAACEYVPLIVFHFLSEYASNQKSELCFYIRHTLRFINIQTCLMYSLRLITISFFERACESSIWLENLIFSAEQIIHLLSVLILKQKHFLLKPITWGLRVWWKCMDSFCSCGIIVSWGQYKYLIGLKRCITQRNKEESFPYAFRRKYNLHASV